MFDQVEQLVRLLLIIPASSAEAERSFSSLRRLKSYLRTTMKQERLNHCTVLHVHQAEVDNLDVIEITQLLKTLLINVKPDVQLSVA